MEPNSSDRSIMPTVWALGSGLLAASTTLGLIFLVSNSAKSQLQLFVGGVALVAWVIFILVLMSALRGNGAKQGFLVGGPATRLILAILVIGVSAIALIGTPIVMNAAYFGVPFQLGYSGGIRRGDQIGRLAFLLLSSLVPMLAAALVVARTSLIRNEAKHRAMVVVGYLEQAVRLNLPLPQMIWAASRSETGAIGRRLQSLHAHLETGEPIDVALEVSVPEIPIATIHAIRGADRVGRLPHTLARLCRTAVAPEDPNDSRGRFYRAYLPALLLGAGNLLVIEEIWVAQKLSNSLRDFHVPEPTMLFGMNWLQFYEDIEGPLVAGSFLLAIALLCGLIYSYQTTLLMGRRFSWTWGRNFVDGLVWRLPVFGAIRRDQSAAGLCDFLADAIDAGQPLDEALAHAADAQGNSVFRRRVLRWSVAVSTGQPIDESARIVGMPSLMVGMIAPARRAEELVQVFTWLARYFENRIRRLATLIQSVWMPLCVVLVGALIAFVAYGMFDAMSIIAARAGKW